MKTKFLFFAFTVFTLVLSACGAAAPSPTAMPAVPVTGSATATSGGAMPAMPAAAAAVAVAQNSKYGPILVDSKGMTLYLFTTDTPNKSNCYTGCVAYWPPLLTTGAPTAGTGVTASLLGVTQRTDGTTQVTYNGWPLYYYVSDKAAGDTTGENVQGTWFVVTPDGMQK